MSVLRLTLISDPSKFKSGLDKASKELKSFGSVASKVSSGVTRALGTVGLGLGVAKLTGYLKESAKAAAEDAVSKNQLALSLRNTLGATLATTDAAERWIQKTSNAVAVLDDDLRPALADAVRATGSLDRGQSLLNLALDIAAAKGKNLGAVTNALSKAYGGQYTSLQKLLPGVKLGVNFYADLTKQFKGSAEAAADLNPYQRLTVIFENLKEEVGTAILPLVKQFAEYLQSPDGQRNLQQIVKILGGIGVALGTVVKFFIENIVLVKAVVAGVLTAKLAIGGLTLAMKLYDIATKLATISTQALKYALISTGIGAIAVAVGTLATAWMAASEAQEDYYTQVEQSDAFRRALEATGDATVEINENLGQIWQDGVLIFDQQEYDQQVQRVQSAIEKAKDNITKTAEKFRDSVGLAFGVSGKDEYSFFNVDKVIAKLKRMVDAARGFGDNLKNLVRQGAGQDVINELIGMGPAQGNIVAKGLLKSGRLSEYLGLRGSLYGTGSTAAGIANTAGEKTYTININKANVSAADIIAEIRKFEKQTNKKYFVN